MPESQLTVKALNGLRGESAAVFRARSAGYSGEVAIGRPGGHYLPGHDILALVSLDLRAGDVVNVRVDGQRAEEKLAELIDVLSSDRLPAELCQPRYAVARHRLRPAGIDR